MDMMMQTKGTMSIDSCGASLHLTSSSSYWNQNSVGNWAPLQDGGSLGGIVLEGLEAMLCEKADHYPPDWVLQCQVRPEDPEAPAPGELLQADPTFERQQ